MKIFHSILPFTFLLASSNALETPESFILPPKKSDARELAVAAFDESTCPTNLETCTSKLGTGLSLDGWDKFLGNLNGDPGSSVHQIRSFVQQSQQVNFTEIVDVVNNGGLSSQDEANILAAISSLTEAMQSLNDTGTNEAIANFNTASLPKPIANFFSSLFFIITFPLRVVVLIDLALIFLPIYFFWRIFIYKPVTPVTPARKSALVCQAALLNCEYDAMLMKMVPSMLTDAFVAAGKAT
jgi:hypothetical protein